MELSRNFSFMSFDFKQFENVAQHVETGDAYACEHWDVRRIGMFFGLGIVRAVTEGKFTDEERVRAVETVEVDLRSLEPIDSLESRDRFRKALEGLAQNDGESVRFLREYFGNAARHAAQVAREKAPSVEKRREINIQEGRAADEDENPTHIWLNGYEAKVASDYIFGLVELLENPVSDKDSHHTDIRIQANYAAGYLQQLVVILEHLRDKIDNEEIVVGTPKDPLSADDCIERVIAARDMIVKSLRPIDMEKERTSLPECDEASLDLSTIQKASDVAVYLENVKQWSV